MSKKNSTAKNLKEIILTNNRIFHLFQKFEKNLKNINKNRFVVAVSGGPDSLALAAFAKHYQKEKKKNILIYFVLVDHGIRKNSYKEAIKVKKNLKKISINLTILKNRIKIKKNLQSQARDIRYSLLTKFCKKKKALHLFTGHHQDDQIETFLIRLSRGSGVQGLSSMQKETKINNNIKLVRPMLDFKKKDLLFVSKKIFGTYIKDPSNLNKKYLRTKVRSLKNSLEKYGLTHDAIIKSINNLRSSRDTINIYVQKIFSKIVDKKKDYITIDLKRFLGEEKEIQFKILSMAFKNQSKTYYPPRSKKILNVVNQIQSSKEMKLTLGGCIVKKSKKQIILERET